MRRNQNQNPLLWLLPVPMLLWLAALLATEYKAGMTVFTLMGRLSWLMEHPFSVRWTPHTPKFMLWALDNDHCILFIRGELPVMDRKYDILKHPGLKLTEDGGAAPYIHRPGLTYALEDLPLSTDSWESIEIIE